jgi:hypothetical protein
MNPEVEPTGTKPFVSASPESSLTAWSQSSDRFFWFGLSAFVYLIELLVRGRVGEFGTIGPKQYWAFQWVNDYSRGLVRRGLIGATLRLLHLNTTSYGLIAIGSLAISTAIYLLFIAALYDLVRDFSRIEKTFAAIVMALSPLTAGMLLETTGDPIQLLILGFLALFRFVVVPARGTVLAAISFAALGAGGAFIHEAGAFFLLPAAAIAAFLLQKTPSARAAFFGYLAGSVLCTALVVLLPVQATPAGHVAELPALHYHGASLAMSPEQFRPFSVVFKIELERNFGHGLKGDARTLLRFFGVAVLPFLLICVATALFYGGDAVHPVVRRRIFSAFLVAYGLSAPLYIIAYDWGRFSSYTFLLTLTVLALWGKHSDRTAANLTEVNRQIPFGIGLLIAGTTLVPLPTGYVWNGMIYGVSAFLGQIAIIALLVAQTRGYWREALSPWTSTVVDE